MRQLSFCDSEGGSAGVHGRGCGIKNALTVRTLDDFEAILAKALAGNELVLIIAKVEPGEDPVELPRQEARENKYRFVRRVKQRKIFALSIRIHAEEKKTFYRRRSHRFE